MGYENKDSLAYMQRLKGVKREESNLPPKGLWAAGEYWINCMECRKDFLGHEFAKECAVCAYA